ncbi:hypothetical protein [Polaromonas sp.]|uniref:hypothetical protein n=1 Tax=Polaromonas sp. TaxID=1869339 RepID=UPI00272FC0F4|nr:hypothetical protein [Polaromonas sp.]MDP1742663.1 hypothetical protein [Polaromonas sp.]
MEITDSTFEAANRHGAAKKAAFPAAVAVRYHRRISRIVISHSIATCITPNFSCFENKPRSAYVGQVWMEISALNGSDFGGTQHSK